ncbi:ester cyclase [Aliirhizobium smilacinae]|uniref:Ester cyclase n=1 Tax=Aliirhizobium smilacinae TaxID=1395944 RepID=A0A5C4XBH9_9HYPH|nr:ester cyclase [Rhizobium smilacinae]TNM60825.1 ester cyclase [Rhizobium smilacinae]
MTEDLSELYRGYIDCLNRQDWTRLGDFVGADVIHNDRRIGLDGYHAMLVGDFRAIPDLRFSIDFLVVEAPHLAARLLFDCTPTGDLFGLPVNGLRVRFCENVFYRFSNGRIVQVWSVIDKAAIEAQLS